MLGAWTFHYEGAIARLEKAQSVRSNLIRCRKIRAFSPNHVIHYAIPDTLPPQPERRHATGDGGPSLAVDRVSILSDIPPDESTLPSPTCMFARPWSS